MSQLLKEYSTTLKSFKLMGFIILIFSLAYIINEYNPDSKESLSLIISLGILAIIFSSFLFYFGQKKRTIKLFNDRIEYSKSKVEFDILWKEIILIKSFKEMNKSSENLVIMTKNEEIYTFSTAFFEREKLISCFNEIININLNREDFTIEDDRQWQNNK